MSEGLLKEQAITLTNILPRLARSMFSIYQDDPAKDLPVAQLRVCSVLREGPVAMSSLSKELGISLSAMTQIADRLEKAGLVDRIAEADDRRVKSLRLTPHGQEVMRIRQERRARSAFEVLEQLPPDSRESVLKAFQDLLDACARRGKNVPCCDGDSCGQLPD